MTLLEIPTGKSVLQGQVVWSNTDPDLYLTTYTVNKQSPTSNTFAGMTLTFTDEFGIKAATTGTVGSINGPSVTYTQYSRSGLQERITKVYICANTIQTQKTQAVFLITADGTTYLNPDPATHSCCTQSTQCDATASYYIPSTGTLPGRLRGFSFNQKTMNAGQTDYQAVTPDWSVLYDSDPCSMTTVYAPATSMTIYIGQGPTTLNLNSFCLNTVAVAGGNSAQCGTSYLGTIITTKSFLSIAGSTITGTTSNSADKGVYNITVQVDLKPYDRALIYVTVNVFCNMQPPSFTQSTFTIQVGITAQPFNIPFTQPNSCGTTATMSGGGPWLTMPSSLTSGGNLQVNGATLSNVGSFTATLTNNDGLISQLTTITIIIQDPCQTATFQTIPSPFSNINVVMPTSTPVTTNFTIKTNIWPIVCPITASFTTSYAPLTVASPYSSTLLTTSSIVLPNDVGTHAVTIQIHSSDFPATLLPVSFNFNVVVTCPISSFTINTAVTDFNYILNSGTVVKGPFTPVQVSSCNYPVSYSVEQFQGATSLGSATSLFNTASQSYSFEFTSPSQINTVQTFVLTSSINVPNSGVVTQTSSLHITIQPDCLNTHFIAKTITDMSIQVTGSLTQDMTFSDSTADFFSNPTFCGTRIYTFTPSLPSFLLMNSATGILTLATNNPADASSVLYTLSASLTSYPSVPAISSTFRVTVTCVIQSLSFLTQPSNLFVEPGVTSQPITSSFATTQFPACNFPATFSFLSAPPSFITLTSLTSSAGNVQVSGATSSNDGTYSLTIQATASGLTAQSSISIHVSDPCRRVILQPASPSPLAPMTLTRNFDASKLQTYSISTDLLISPGITCPLVCTLVSPPTYVSQVSSTINVNEAQTTSSDTGSHTISLACSSANFLTSVTSVTYSFQLLIQECVVNTFGFASVFNNQVYTINTGPFSISSNLALLSNLNCLYPVTYTASFQQSGTSISQPSFITYNANSNSFPSITPTLPSEIGLYQVNIHASIPDPAQGSTATKTINAVFTIQIANDCLSTSIISKSFQNMSIFVTQSTTQDITFEDTKANFYSIPDYCGPRVINFSGGIPSYLSLDVTETTLTLSTSNVLDAGNHTVTFSVSLLHYPSVTPVTKSFQAIIVCEVFTLTFATPPANKLIEPGITAQPLTWSFVTNQIPACAKMVLFSWLQTPPFFVSLNNVLAQSGSIVVDGASFANDGLYSLTLRATVDSQVQDASFDVQISNPCKRAILPSPNPSPLLDVVRIRNFDPIHTQSFSILSDIASQHSISCNMTYALVSPPNFVSLSGTSIAVDPSLTILADVGTHTITLLVASTDFSASVVPVQYSFQLTIEHCVVNTYSLAPILDVNYVINQGPLPVSFSLGVWSNLLCLYTQTHTASYSKSGVAVSPAFINFDLSSRNFMIETGSMSDVGVYTVTLTATIPQPSDPSLVKQVSTDFTLTVQNDCDFTQLLERAVNDMTVKVSLQTSQDLVFNDSKGNLFQDQGYCGPRVYSFTGGMPSFLSFDPDMTTLRLSTSNVGDKGTHLVEFSVSLQEYPIVASITKQFTVYIICEAFDLSFNQSPADIFIETGVTIQPQSVMFKTNQIPACGNAVTFSILGTVPSFVSLQNMQLEEGKVTVLGAVLADQNVYSLTLQAAVDAQTITAPFVVEISDPCKRAVFQDPTTSPIADMILIRDFDTTEQQTFSMTTDVQQQYALVCSYVATLVSPPAYLSLSGSTLTATESLTTQGDVAQHVITVQVDSLLYAASVATQFYTFELDVQHCVTSSFFIATPADHTYTLNSPIDYLTVGLAVWNDLACRYTATYSASYQKNSVTIPQPYFLNFDASTPRFEVQATTPDAVGTYELIVTVTLPQPSDPSGFLTISTSFILTIVNDCPLTYLLDMPISDMQIYVSQSTSQNINFLNERANHYSIPGICGANTLTWNPTLPSFLSVDAAQTTLTLQTSNVNDVAFYQFELTICLADFPLISCLQKTFDVTILCQVFDLMFSLTPANIFIETGVTPQPQYSQFVTSQTPNCGHAVTFSILGTVPSFLSLQNLQLEEGKVTVQGAVLADQNVYSLTLQAAVDAQTITVPFVVEISDPCKRAVIQDPTTSPIAGMILIRDFDTTVQQTFSITTDVQQQYALVCQYVATLVSPPAYLSLSGSTLTTTESLTTQGDVAQHVITVQVDSLLYAASVATQFYTFELDVQHCVTSSFSIATPADHTYTLNSPIDYLTVGPAVWNDLACRYTATYSASYQQNSVTIPQPYFLNFDASTPRFEVQATTPDAVGSYELIVTVTLPQPSDPSGFLTISTSFILTIVNDCPLTYLLDMPISDMQIYVSQSTSQNINFLNERANHYSIPGICGANTLTWNPTLPSFLSVDAAQTTLTLQTNDELNIGSYQLELTVCLADFPLIPCLTKQFRAIIRCQVFDLSFAQFPANIFIETGVTPQPQSVTFQTSQLPACGNQVSFSLLGTVPSFVSLQNLQLQEGEVTVDGAVLLDQDVYSLTLQATVDAQTITAPFVVEISDPCKRAVFQDATTRPIADMILIRDFDTTVQQTFTITTDVQQQYALVCSYVATLVSPPAYLSLTGSTLTATESLTTQGDVAQHVITVQVDSLLYAASVATQFYTFVLDVQHCVTNSFSIATPAAHTYALNSPIDYLSVGPAVWDDLACWYTATYSASYQQNSVTIPQPYFLNFDASTPRFEVQATTPDAVGSYELTVTVSLPQPSDPSGFLTISTSFILTIVNDCPLTYLIDMPINDMQIYVSQSTSQNINFLNERANHYSIPGICGTNTLTWNPTLPSFLSVDAAQTTLTLQTSNVNDVAFYQFELTVCLADFPLIPCLQKTFDVTILCQVFDLMFLLTPANIFIETGVTPQPQYSQFVTSQTPNCGHAVTFSILGTVPSFLSLQNLQLEEGKVTVLGAILADQNVYSLTLQAAVDAQTITAPFTVEISDPCKRAVFQDPTTSPIADMILIRDFDTTVQQTFSITTDVQQQYALVCSFVATLVSPPAYLSLSGSLLTATESLTTQADVAQHIITLQVDSLLYAVSVATQFYTFVLDVQHCVTNSFTIATRADHTYALNSPIDYLSVGPAVWNDLACRYTATYSASYQQNSVTIPQPYFLNFDATTPRFEVQATTPDSVGSYELIVTVTLPQPSDPSGFLTISTSFILTIVNDCPLTYLLDLPINDMQIYVSQSTSQNINFQNERAVYYNIAHICGPNLITWTPTLPSFLQVDAANSILTLTTNDVNDVGSLQFQFTISLPSYPMILSISKTIRVTILCEVFSLNFLTPPSNIFIETGVTPQPQNSMFVTSQTPNCGHAVTFSIPGTIPSFVSLQNLQLEEGKVTVLGAILADQNVYSLTLQAAVDAQTITAPFTVEISDPCKRAVFQNPTTSPIADMILIRDFDTTVQQTFSITTDVQQQYALVCSYVATLVSPPAYLSLSGSKLIATESLTTQADVAQHVITVQVDSLLYTASVATQFYTFVLDVQHCVTNSFSIASVPPATYLVKHPQLSISYSPAIFSNNACRYTISYTASFELNGISIPQPPIIAYSSLLNQFQVISSNPLDIGIYVLTVTASIPQPSLPAGNLQVSVPITLTITSDCLQTVFVDKPFTDMAIQIGQSLAQNITFDDSIDLLYYEGYCGLKQVSFTGIMPSFLTLDAAQTTLTLASNNVPDVSIYTFSFQVQLVDYPSVAVLQKTFKVTITCVVQVLQIVTAPTDIIVEPGITPQPATTAFSVTQTPACNNPVQFGFNSTPPSFVSIVGVSGQAGNVQVSGAAVPSNTGTYSLVLTAQVDSQLQTSSFFVRIIEPCMRTILQPQDPLVNLILIRNFDTTFTQLVTATTDVEQQNGVFCPYVASLVSPPGFVSISNNMISIQESLTTAGNFGINTINVRIDSQTFPANVAPIFLTFDVDVQHCAVNIMSFPSIADQQYVIKQGIVAISFMAASFSDLACRYTISYSISSVVKNGVAIAQPFWLLLNQASMSISYNALYQNDVANYMITVMASIPQPSLAAGVKFVTSSFILNVVSDCNFTTLINRIISDISVVVFRPASTESVFVYDTKAQLNSTLTYCGQRSYNLSPVYPFLTITNDVLSLQSMNLDDVGVYNMELTVTLSDYPQIPSMTMKFVATVVCTVVSISIDLVPPPVIKYTIAIDRTTMVPFKFTEFPTCTLDYSIEPAQSFISVPTGKSELSILTDSLQSAGEYNLVLVAAPRYGIAPVRVPFTVILIDPCVTTNFYSQQIPDLSVFRQDPSISMQRKISFEPFSYDVLTLYGVNCGLIINKLISLDAKEKVEPWITATNDSVDVDFEQADGPGTWHLGLVTSLANYPHVTITSNFVVRLSQQQIICRPAAQIKYMYGDPTLTFQVMYFNSTVNEGMNLTSTYKPFVIDENENEQNLPKFIEFDSNSALFKAFATSQNDLGIYTLALQISLLEYPDFHVTCTQQLLVDYRPTFRGERLGTQVIFQNNTSWSLDLPQYLDSFGAKAIVIVSLKETQQFLSWSQTLRKIWLSGLATEGNYSVTIQMTDKFGNVEEYQVPIKVIPANPFEGLASNITNWQPTDKQQSPPVPFIKYINQLGVVRVGFSKPLQLPSFALYPEFEDQRLMRQNCTNQTCEIRRLQTLNTTIHMQALAIVNRGLVVKNNTLMPVVQLTMKPGIQSDPGLLNFTWSCVEFTPFYMDFQINYTRHMNVSIHDFKDALKVDFVGNQYFRSQSNFEYIEQSVAVLAKNVPLQLYMPEAGNLIHLTSTVREGAKAILISSLVIKLLFGGPIRRLFDTVRKLSIMVHLLIINISVPANVQYYFAGLLSFIRIDLFPIEDRLRSILNLYEDDVKIDNMWHLGYRSNYFLLNIGNLGLVLDLILILLAFRLLTSKIERPWVVRLRSWLTDCVVWNPVLMFLTELYFVFCVSTVTNLAHAFNFSTFGSLLNTNVSMIAVVVLCGLPVFVQVLLWQRQADFLLITFHKRFRYLYDALTTKRESRIVLLDPLWYYLRVFTMTLTLVQLQSRRTLQILVALFWFTFTLMWVGFHRYRKRERTFFEQFNECFIAITIYHVMCFADTIDDQLIRNKLGWSLIILISFCLITNFAYIANASCKHTYRKVMTWWYTMQIREMKLLQQERESRRKLKQAKLIRLRLPEKEPFELEEPQSHVLEMEKDGSELMQSHNDEFILQRPRQAPQDAIELDSFELPEQNDLAFQNLQSNIQNQTDIGLLDRMGQGAIDKPKKHRMKQKLKVRSKDQVLAHVSLSCKQQKPNKVQVSEQQLQIDDLDQAIPSGFVSKRLSIEIQPPTMRLPRHKQELSIFTQQTPSIYGQEQHSNSNDDTRFEDRSIVDEIYGLIKGPKFKPSLARTTKHQTYEQKPIEYDDPSEHSARVSARQEEINWQIQKPSDARELFDKLWNERRHM